MNTFSTQELETLSAIWSEIVSAGHPLWVFNCFIASILLGVHTYFKIIDIADRSESLEVSWFLILRFIGSSIIISALLFPYNPVLPTALKMTVSLQHFTISGMLHAPISGITMKDAIASLNATEATNQYTAQTLSNCTNLIEEESISKCLTDPDKIARLLRFYQETIDTTKANPLIGNLLDIFLDEIENNNLNETVTETVINSPDNIKVTSSIFWGIHNKANTVLVKTIIFYTAFAPFFISFLVNPHLSIVFHQWLLILIQLFIAELSGTFIIGITAICEQILSDNGVAVGSISNTFNTSLELGLIVPISLVIMGAITNISFNRSFSNFINQYSQMLGSRADSYAYKKFLKYFRNY